MSDFLPSLSTLIPVENIPDNFGVIRNGINNIFSHLYYKDLIVDKSVEGDVAFYSLSIVTYKRLDLEIPGTNGMALVLNPSFNGTSTEFSISFGYTWNILKYSPGFDLSTFDWSLKSFFDILLDIAGVTPE